MAKSIFVNKILTYPNEIRQAIDKLILEGLGSMQIRRYVKTNYPDYQLSTPTIAAYIRFFKTGKKTTTEKEMIESEEQEIENIESSIKNLETMFIEDRPAYIDTLIYKVNKKLTMYDNLDKTWGRLDLKKEASYQKYIEIARNLTETRAKLGGELQADNNIVLNVITAELPKFIKIAHDAVKEVCPEKLLEFKEAFKRKYQEQKGEIVSEQKLLKGE